MRVLIEQMHGKMVVVKRVCLVDLNRRAGTMWKCTEARVDGL